MRIPEGYPLVSTTLILLTNDYDLLDYKRLVPYTIKGYLTTYPENSVELTGYITYIDPCATPVGIGNTFTGNNQYEYDYLGVFTWQLPEPFSGLPVVCPITYTCCVRYAEAPSDTDWKDQVCEVDCNFSNGNVALATFDPETSYFEMDIGVELISIFVPGNKFITIRGIIGSNPLNPSD